MTAKENLEYFKSEWARHLVGCAGLDADAAKNAVVLAEFNGLFDPLKTLFGIQGLLNPDEAEENFMRSYKVGDTVRRNGKIYRVVKNPR